MMNTVNTARVFHQDHLFAREASIRVEPPTPYTLGWALEPGDVETYRNLTLHTSGGSEPAPMAHPLFPLLWESTR